MPLRLSTKSPQAAGSARTRLPTLPSPYSRQARSAGRQGQRARHIEPHRRAPPPRQMRRALAGAQHPAGSRIERRPVRIAGAGAGARDFAARAKAGIDELIRFEARERGGVIGDMFALDGAAALRRSSRARRDRLRWRARYAGLRGARSMSSMRSRKRPPAPRRGLRIEQRRIGVAEVQAAVGRRREAEDAAEGGGIHVRTCMSRLARKSLPVRFCSAGLERRRDKT